jgi:hypothetical protein
MLTHTRAKVPASTVEFGNMNGFIASTTNTNDTLVFTHWNADANDSAVRTFTIEQNKCPVNVFVPLAVKKVVGHADDVANLTIYGV